MSIFIKGPDGEIVGGGVNTAMLPPGVPVPPRPMPRPQAGAPAPRPMRAPPQQGDCEARVRQLEAELAALRGEGRGHNEAFRKSIADNRRRIDAARASDPAGGVIRELLTQPPAQ